METRLLRVKHDEPSQVVVLEHSSQAGKFVASEWAKKIFKSCDNITHIVIASKIRSAHFRLYKDNELYYELDGFLDVMRRQINYGYRSKLEKKDRMSRLDPSNHDNIFPDFM